MKQTHTMHIMGTFLSPQPGNSQPNLQNRHAAAVCAASAVVVAKPLLYIFIYSHKDTEKIGIKNTHTQKMYNTLSRTLVGCSLGAPGYFPMTVDVAFCECSSSIIRR